MGTNEPKVLSGRFNPKATGIATVIAMIARLKYGGSVDDCLFLEFVLKKKKEGVRIILHHLLICKILHYILCCS